MCFKYVSKCFWLIDSFSACFLGSNFYTREGSEMLILLIQELCVERMRQKIHIYIFLMKIQWLAVRFSFWLFIFTVLVELLTSALSSKDWFVFTFFRFLSSVASHENFFHSFLETFFLPVSNLSLSYLYNFFEAWQPALSTSTAVRWIFLLIWPRISSLYTR